MKKSISIMIVLSFILSLFNTAMAHDIINYSVYRKLEIKGYISQTDMESSAFESRSVSAMVKNNGSIIALDEEEIDLDGNYRFLFSLPTEYDLNDCTLSVRIGNKNAVSTVVSAVATDEQTISVPTDIYSSDGKTKISCDFTELAEMCDEYKAITARYSEGRLQEIQSFDSSEFTYSNGSVTFEHEYAGEYSAADIKVFVWKSLKTMLPVGNITNGVIDFGADYRKQELEGYRPLIEDSSATAEEQTVRIFSMNVNGTSVWTDKWHKALSELGITAEKLYDSEGNAYAGITFPSEMSEEKLVNLRKYSGQEISLVGMNPVNQFEFSIMIPNTDEVINKKIFSITTGGMTYEKICLYVRNDVTNGKTGLYFATRNPFGSNWKYTPIKEIENGTEGLFDEWLDVKFDIDIEKRKLTLYHSDNTTESLWVNNLTHEDYAIKSTDKLLYFGVTFKNSGSEPVTLGIKSFDIKKTATVSSDYLSYVYNRYTEARSEIEDEAKLVTLPEVNSQHSIYVSPGGDDENNNGTLEKPYQTIQKAIEVVSDYTEENKKNYKTIYLLGGEYYIDETVIIDESICADDGKARLIIKPYNNQKVIFTSSKEITGSKFKKVTAENTSAEEYVRLNSAALDNLYYCDYADIGIDEIKNFIKGTSGKMPVLTYKGTAMNVSRYPNIEEIGVSEIIESGFAEKGETRENPVFVPTDLAHTEWKNPDNKIGIKGQLCKSWTYSSTFVDFDGNSIILPVGYWTWSEFDGTTTGISEVLTNNTAVASHFYYYNVLEELDIPYEWCAEDAQQRVYFYPPEGVIRDMDLIGLSGNDLATVFTVKNVADIVIDGMGFTNISKAFDISNSSNVVINNADISYASAAVNLNNTTKCGIINSEIKSVSGTAINISDSTERFNALTPSRNFVQNNHFNDGVTMINISANGNIISHNLCENYTKTMVYITAGCENIIEYNESVAGATAGNEGASIYIGGQYNCRHNHIRYNYIHDNELPDAKVDENAGGIAVDDLGECEYIYNNTIKNLSGMVGGINLNGGDNHVIDSNIIIDCGSSISFTGQYTNTYQDMYYKNISRYFMTDDIESSQYLNHYYNMGLENSEAWNNRYSYLPARLEWYKSIREIWDTSTIEDSDDMRFFVAATGNHALNNTIINCNEAINFDSVSIEYCTTVDVKNGEYPPMHEGTNFNYNVEYGTITGDSYDMSTITYLDKTGLVGREPEYSESSDKLNMILPYDNSGVITGSELSFSWLAREDANYYKVTVASDSEFKNVIAEKSTFKTGCIIEVPDGTYYYKVEAFSLRNGKEGKLVAITKGDIQ